MPAERKGHLPLARLLAVLGLIIVTLVTLRFTVFKDEGSVGEGPDIPSLKGKSMAIADTTTINLSPYAWGRLITQDGYLAYVKDGMGRLLRIPLRPVRGFVLNVDVRIGRN